MSFWLVGSLLLGIIVVLAVANLWLRRDEIQREIEPLYGVEDQRFVHTISVLLGPPLTGGHSVKALLNGDEIFPAMLEAIGSARRTITFETFIYWEGSIGKKFADAISDRARAGVRCHLVLDWVGANRMNQEWLKQMKDAGAEVCYYRPLRWWNLTRMNNRTHRKLLVIDGKVGFTGGVGIADEWLGQAQDPEHWRDSHFRIEGPAVAQMQAAFMDNWVQTNAVLLHGEDYFPLLESRGDTLAQMFTSAPENGTENARLMYLLSIASAQRSIQIASAYFVPDELSISTLCDAKTKRGVDVKILVPGSHIDTHVTRRASRSLWEPLLECGIEIYEFQPTMFHVKIMIVDGIWVSVGSTNFDNRSFKLNDEANLNIWDRNFAEQQTAVFDADLERAKRVTLEDWRNRPLREKAIEQAAKLVRWQL